MTFFLIIFFYYIIGDSMKKILLIILLVFVIISNMSFDLEEDNYEVRCIFISYIELSKYIKNYSDLESMNNIDTMINNIKKMKFNTIILQVRSTADSIYNSKLFPTSMYISDEEGKYRYDVLDYFIKKAHKNNLKLYAWINPYRIRVNDNILSITEKSPAYKYIGTDVIYVNNGIFFNPSKEVVSDLIVDGVLEVLKYDVDAVMFDDYFYPSDDIDLYDYETYVENHNYISIKDYHLMVVNDMVKRVHDVCSKKNVKFGISPDGNIENNYNKNYADVKRWMSDDQYIDFIMPQIYYGFYNSTRGYVKVIKEWEGLNNKNIDLLIALAFYKVGHEDNYAKEGRDEWLNNDNVIMREIFLSRNLKNYKGFSLFRYDSLFDNKNYTVNTISEIENMKKIIK